jgi:hypothetical protein
MIPVQVKVDATRALAWFGPAGIPEGVRKNLRATVPSLTKRLGTAVNANLDSGLKSRNRLQVKSEMVENPTSVYGRVTTIATSPPQMLPRWLEEGTAPHLIAARNASALFFFWEKMGRNVSFRSVNHPGFKGIFYMKNAFDAMEPEIVAELSDAVRQGVEGARQ